MVLHILLFVGLYLLLGVLSSRINIKFLELPDSEVPTFFLANLFLWPFLLLIGTGVKVYDKSLGNGNLARLVRGRKHYIKKELSE